MQETRQHILDILRSRGQATVENIVEDLRERKGEITAVTVRHHLAKLQEQDLVASPKTRHRDAPGRPQHIYALTDKASSVFPNNYQQLAESLLRQIRQVVPAEGVNVILEGVAVEMAKNADIPDGIGMNQRLDAVVDYLSEHGYEAYWEASETNYVLHTVNCPYHQIAKEDETLCEMDMRLISSMLGVVPRRISHLSAGEPSCAYLIPIKEF